MLTNSLSPIGVFDSGLGGLTVVKELKRQLPNESIYYLGDTARIPYGAKSPDTIIRYAHQIADFLLGHSVKCLVIACNTASAHAMASLQQQLPIPVIGVITPGAQLAVHATLSGQIGVLGTLGTVASGAYQRAIHATAPHYVVFSQACPLLVPLAEEGWSHHAVTAQVIRHYLLELRGASMHIDTLILGCTHYPLLRDAIAHEANATFAQPVRLVDSAEAVVGAVQQLLTDHHIAYPENEPKRADRYFFTDVNRLEELSLRFLGEKIETAELADL